MVEPKKNILYVTKAKLYRLAKVKESSFRIHMQKKSNDQRMKYIKQFIVNSGIDLDYVSRLELKNAARTVSL